MKRILAGLCAAFLTASTAATAFAYPNEVLRTLTSPIWMPENTVPDNEIIPPSQSAQMLPIEKMSSSSYNSDGSISFLNYADGYGITLPSEMTIDMSMAQVGAHFTDEHRSLRIFKESFSSADDRAAYLEYSNKFLVNTADHTLENDETINLGRNTIRMLQWSRKPLARINKDKCFYACVDVISGMKVYTFFFTADTPFYMCGGYMDIVNSLTTFDPTIPKENVYTRGYKKSELSHLAPSAQKTFQTLFADDASFKMGVFLPDQYGGFKKLEEFEKTLNYKFSTYMTYTECLDKHGINSYLYSNKVTNYMSRMENYFRYMRTTKKVFELTLQTPLSRVSDSNMIYEILNGEYDQFLTQYARLISRYKDVTVLFRPFNEMNCDWCNYSAYFTSRDPQIYVELYRYLYTKFKGAGCTNMIWVWNPNEISYPKFKWNDEQLYYPGDEYVDVYGLTGYNTGTYYPGEKWRSFDEIYAPIYNRAERINEKPMMITEFSCSSDGGDKKAWIDDMFNSLPKYSKIKLGIWWHAADYDGDNIARPYFMDTPDGTLDVFKKHLS